MKNNFMKLTKSALTVGILVALLVIADYFIAPLFVPSGNFVWVAFVSWTVFATADAKERFATIPSYIIGFITANFIIFLGGNLTLPWILSGVFATFLGNFLIMYLADIKFLTISGIFVGIAMTFARVGTDFPAISFSLLGIILVYGILGQICGYISTEINKSKEK